MFVAEKSATTFGDVPDSLVSPSSPVVYFNPVVVFEYHQICVNIGIDRPRKLTTVGGRTNDGILLIRTLGTNFSENLSEIHSFSFKKMNWKVSSAKWHLFRLGLNELSMRE